MLLYLGIGYLSVAIIDTLHALTMFGLPCFHLSSDEISLKFWIYARLFEAILLLSAALLFNALRNKWFYLNIAYGLALLAVILVWWLSFYVEQPYLLLDGKLTSTKIYFEWLIISLLLLATAIFSIKRRHIEKHVLVYILISIALTIAAELSFTLFRNMESHAFVVGHVFKFMSFWALYQAIVNTHFSMPMKMLARSSNSYDAIPHSAVRVDQQGTMQQLNRAALHCIGLEQEQLVGAAYSSLFSSK